MLGQIAADLDFTTDALPREALEIGAGAGATSTYDVGERFGTVGLVFGDLVIEITTFRSETYPTADRRPIVEFGDSIDGDLSRRDFTINAIAVDVHTGALIDPFGGRRHLEERIIEAVGDAAARFNEDPLRILRAARFAAQLGFRVEDDTRTAMSQMAHRLADISAERIAAEMNRLLVGRAPSYGMELLRNTGALRYCVPELLDIAAFAHYCADNLQRARALYERLVDLFPDMPSHHFYLGNTFFRLGNLTRAHEEWRRTIALDTNGEFARKSKARLGGTATDGSGKL